MSKRRRTSWQQARFAAFHARLDRERQEQLRTANVYKDVAPGHYQVCHEEAKALGADDTVAHLYAGQQMPRREMEFYAGFKNGGVMKGESHG